jgi:hypothetical protein
MSQQRERITALLALAQHPNTPRAEAETALAMASKLMLKNGLSDADFAGAGNTDDTDVVVETVHVRGAYRVRRQNLLYGIAILHSCACYRSDDVGDACVVVMYGRLNDIFAARTLFAAADAMGARLIPRGDRSWRVAWWKGFQHGIEEAIAATKKEYIRETPGSGLVLADRMQRATNELRVNGPRLRKTYSYADTSTSAYASGQSAGRGFSAGGRAFTAGVRGELG